MGARRGGSLPSQGVYYVFCNDWWREPNSVGWILTKKEMLHELSQIPRVSSATNYAKEWHFWAGNDMVLYRLRRRFNSPRMPSLRWVGCGVGCGADTLVGAGGDRATFGRRGWVRPRAILCLTWACLLWIDLSTHRRWSVVAAMMHPTQPRTRVPSTRPDIKYTVSNLPWMVVAWKFGGASSESSDGGAHRLRYGFAPSGRAKPSSHPHSARVEVTLAGSVQLEWSGHVGHNKHRVGVSSVGWHGRHPDWAFPSRVCVVPGGQTHSWRWWSAFHAHAPPDWVHSVEHGWQVGPRYPVAHIEHCPCPSRANPSWQMQEGRRVAMSHLHWACCGHPGSHVVHWVAFTEMCVVAHTEHVPEGCWWMGRNPSLHTHRPWCLVADPSAPGPHASEMERHTMPCMKNPSMHEVHNAL